MPLPADRCAACGCNPCLCARLEAFHVRAARLCRWADVLITTGVLFTLWCLGLALGAWFG